MAGELPASARVGRVTLRVAGLEPMVAFYRDTVGLDVLERGSDGRRATLGAGDEALLELRADPDAEPRTPAETGLYHTAFLFPDRGALGDALERVGTPGGASDHLVSEALYLDDPEGNGVELYRDRPRAEWPSGPDGRVRMETRPLDTEALRRDAAGGDGAPAGTTVGHVHLEVSSLDASRAFYADALGLRVRQAGPGALFLAAGDYHHHVGLNVWNGRTDPSAGRGLAAFELRASEDALREARERLADAGFEPGNGGVRDPDGIRLRLRSE
jgi:catechol 2,3-dioxygenase